MKRSALFDVVAVYRAPLAVPVTVLSPRGAEVFTTRNVSLGGLAVLGLADPLQLLGSVSVEFTLPGNHEAITGHARVIWSDANGAAGLRFTALDSIGDLRLRQWILARHAEDESERDTAVSAQTHNSATGT
ncbi:MAG: PilZ domain-containing protein [Terriglobales bacterium]